jgi:hypothetical protein
MFCSDEARMMDISMVIAAWGEGVMCLLSPLPLAGSFVVRPKRALKTGLDC